MSPTYETKEDSIAIVLGPERRDRLHGVSFGVAPTDLSGKERAYKKKLHNTYENLREKDKELRRLKVVVE